MKRLTLRIHQTLLTLVLFLSLISMADAVNINTANAQDIADELKGIGAKKAQAIIDWRESNGQFTTQYELNQVKGIGFKTIEKNKDNIQL